MTCVLVDRDVNQLQNSFCLGAAQFDCRQIDENNVVVCSAGDHLVSDADHFLGQRFSVFDDVQLIIAELVGLEKKIFFSNFCLKSGMNDLALGGED